MNLKRTLLGIYWKLERKITPSLKVSHFVYENILKTHIISEMKWLDLGCGHNIFRPWRFTEEVELVTNCSFIAGVDICLESLKKHRTIINKIQSNINQLPLKGNSFDIVTTNMVIEHLEKPHIYFQEVNRILRPGGLFIFHTPNSLSYKTIAARMIPDILKKRLIYILEGRGDDDVFKTWYRANTKGTITKLADSTSFEIIDIMMMTSPAECMVIPPLAAIELLWIRLLMKSMFEALRPYIIAILKKKL